jgi:cation diffusion facilitator CzcD-associated flavoprotein CzcO
MREVAEKRGLSKHFRFHTSVDKAEWDANANVWRIEIRDVRTGERQMTRATALVSAIGVLVVPSFPKLQGIESFKGEVFHSARWNHDVDLHGKCVAVVGNGSSAYVDLFTYFSRVLHVALIVKNFLSEHNLSQRYPRTQLLAS